MLTPESWIKFFFKEKNLQSADGRPLFAYRVSDSEYKKLAECLRLIFSFETKENIKVKNLNACLVIYAAEWWRREYNGKFRYHDVLNSVGMDADRLAVQELITSGLHFWKRKIRLRNNKRSYLGTLAVEGGLPLNQLGNQGGALERVMVRALNKHMTRNIELDVLVNGYIDDLPKFMRGAEVQEVIVSILDTVAELARKYALSETDNPLKRLDSESPNWRDLFPFTAGHQGYKTILEKLIGITKAQIEKSLPFQLNRILNFSTNDAESSLKASLEIETQIPISSLEIDEIKKQKLLSLPRVQIFCVNNEGDEEFKKNAIIGTKNGEKFIDFRLNMQPWIGKKALLEWWISLRHAGAEIATIRINGGGSVSSNLPWILREADTNTEAMFLGEGSQSIRDKEAYIYIPNELSFEKNECAEFSFITHVFSGKVYKFKGLIRGLLDGNIYTLKTQANGNPLQYLLKGKNISYITNPSTTFIGKPYINAIDADEQKTVQLPKDVTLQFRPIGANNNWQNTFKSLGVYYVRALDSDGNTLLYKKIGIFPDDFNLEFLAGSVNAKGGNYSLEGYGFNTESQISLSTGNACIISPYVKNDKLILSIEKNTDIPPVYCDLNIYSHDTKTDIQISLPFPAIGAILFDSKGEKVANGSSINLSKLLNYRLMLYRGEDREQTFLIEIMLKHLGTTLHSIPITFKVNEAIETIPINNFKEDIKALLTLGESIDCQVIINVVMRGRDVLSFKINPFDLKLELNKEQEKILIKNTRNIFPTEEMQYLELKALSMHAPQKGVINLHKVNIFQGEEERTGFDFSRIEEGAWIIFQSEESSLNVRPTLWAIAGDIETESQNENIAYVSLNQVQKIKNSQERARATESFFDKLIQDFNHESWSYITSLFKEMKHLPLRTIDIWPMIAKNSGMLTAIHVRGHIDITEKLSAEFAICWELIPVDSWLGAFLECKRYLKEHFADENDLNEEIKYITSTISDLSSSLTGVSDIILSRLSIVDNPTLKALSTPNKLQFLNLIHNSTYSEGMFISFSDSNDNEFYSWIMQQVGEVENNVCDLLLPKEYLRASNKNHGIYAAALFPLALAQFSITKKPITSIPHKVYFALNQFLSRQHSYVSTMYSPLLCYLYLNDGDK